MQKRRNNFNTFSPVERVGDFFFKREDLFFPFINSAINGGKLRQGYALINQNRDFIKSTCNNTIITATSVHSPQGIIISKLARNFRMKAIICIGGLKNESQIMNHDLMRQCKEQHADVRLVSGTGMHNVLSSKMKGIKKKEGGFIVEFGINYTENSSVLSCISRQVVNIPNEIQTIIVPCGSGLTLAAIIIGIVKYNKKIKNIIGIGVGPDRRKTIDKILQQCGIEKDYDFFSLYNSYSYSKKYIETYESITFDPIYEAKVWHFMRTNSLNLGDNVLFWIVGNSNLYRK